jgi:hypothetical protein
MSILAWRGLTVKLNLSEVLRHATIISPTDANEPRLCRHSAKAGLSISSHNPLDKYAKWVYDYRK